MSTSESTERRAKFFVPEVIQTSAMDCGPASLKSVLAGYGIHVNYDRLRERCQTDVDGTSVATIETLGQQLGLRAATVMVPLDTLLMKDANSLPAIVVTDVGQGYHFVVVWSVHGSYLQLMDPASGRHFVKKERFLEQIASVTMPFEAAQWRDWAETGSDSIGPLRAKISAVGASESQIDALLARATQDPTWQTFGSLDAAVRMVRALIDSEAINKGGGAVALLTGLLDDDARAREHGAASPIPEHFWSVKADPNSADDEPRVLASGAILVYIEGASTEADVATEQTSAATDASVAAPDPSTDAGRRTRLSVIAQTRVPGRRTIKLESSIFAASDGHASRVSAWSGHVVPKSLVEDLAASEVKPAQLFWDIARLDAGKSAYLILALTALSVFVSAIDVLTMRGLSEAVGRIALAEQRVHIIFGVAMFMIVALGLDAVRAQLSQRMGRGLETRLRVSFLEKLPKLEDRYLRTRPLSDMASRAHLLQMLREVPSFATNLFSTALDLILTVALLIWIYPQGWWITLIAFLISFAIPFAVQASVDEQYAKIATHGGALFRFYLDALLGVVPVRVHGAERVIRREHEGLLTEWARSSRTLEATMFTVRVVEGLVGGAITVALVYNFVVSGGPIQKLLLLVFFAQRVPAVGAGLIGAFAAYPSLKHNALRLFEPLGAAEANVPDPSLLARKKSAKGVNISFNEVDVAANGQMLLSGVNLSIDAGTHVGVVGASGAGKSTLLGVLLGWLNASEGRVTIDGRPLDAARLARLREECAWVDPGIQIWNATVLDNLMYGSDEHSVPRLQGALELSDVTEVLERLPDGLLSELGEGGARVSGGQGQRVRFARALMKTDARLVLLDEPFRGLERDRRQKLLRRAREQWNESTMLFVSHDVSDTLGLDRILVIDGGQIVEDGSPEELMAQADSRYRALVEADQNVRAALWDEMQWRRVRIEQGTLTEQGDA